jgi:hypothetical protein
VLGDDDPAYTGWVRLGIVERHYVRQADRSWAPPTEAVTVFAGAVAVLPGGEIPSGALPFSESDASDWWDQKPPASAISPRLPLGPVIRLTRVTDWLGDALALIPPIWLRSYLPLHSAAYGAPLVWTDMSMVPALVLRTWRVRNGEALFAQPAEYEGCDLIARPDIVERLHALYYALIRELRVVRRQPMRDSDLGE